MDGTIILPCSCNHADQDQMYGKGRRLHNIAGKSGTEQAFCTVCTPRRSPGDRMAANLTPMPHIGFRGTGPGLGNKQGKSVPRR